MFHWDCTANCILLSLKVVNIFMSLVEKLMLMHMYGTLLFILRNCIRNKFLEAIFDLIFILTVQVLRHRLPFSGSNNCCPPFSGSNKCCPPFRVSNNCCPPFRVSNNCCPPFRVSNNCCPPFRVSNNCCPPCSVLTTATSLVAAPATVALIFWLRLQLQLWLRTVCSYYCMLL